LLRDPIVRVLRDVRSTDELFLLLSLATSAKRNRPPYSTQSAAKSCIVRQYRQPV
jgi:hypothetical protein